MFVKKLNKRSIDHKAKKLWMFRVEEKESGIEKRNDRPKREENKKRKKRKY